jgi:hypothetical protein
MYVVTAFLFRAIVRGKNKRGKDHLQHANIALPDIRYSTYGFVPNAEVTCWLSRK